MQRNFSHYTIITFSQELNQIVQMIHKWKLPGAIYKESLNYHTLMKKQHQQCTIIIPLLKSDKPSFILFVWLYLSKRPSKRVQDKTWMSDDINRCILHENPATILDIFLIEQFTFCSCTFRTNENIRFWWDIRTYPGLQCML